MPTRSSRPSAACGVATTQRSAEQPFENLVSCSAGSEERREDDGGPGDVWPMCRQPRRSPRHEAQPAQERGGVGSGRRAGHEIVSGSSGSTFSTNQTAPSTFGNHEKIPTKQSRSGSGVTARGSRDGSTPLATTSTSPGIRAASLALGAVTNWNLSAARSLDVLQQTGVAPRHQAGQSTRRRSRCRPTRTDSTLCRSSAFGSGDPRPAAPDGGSRRERRRGGRSSASRRPRDGATACHTAPPGTVAHSRTIALPTKPDPAGPARQPRRSRGPRRRNAAAVLR